MRFKNAQQQLKGKLTSDKLRFRISEILKKDELASVQEVRMHGAMDNIMSFLIIISMNHEFCWLGFDLFLSINF